MASKVDDLTENINRYLLRSVDCTLVFSDKELIVYTKMGSLFILGFIHILKPRDWKSSKLRIINGVFKSHGTSYSLPDYFGNFINQRAGQILELESGISKTQQEKIYESILKDMDRAEKSDTLAAIMLDTDLFGNSAFNEE